MNNIDITHFNNMIAIYSVSNWKIIRKNTYTRWCYLSCGLVVGDVPPAMLLNQKLNPFYADRI